jgi:hypothetical protein
MTNHRRQRVVEIGPAEVEQLGFEALIWALFNSIWIRDWGIVFKKTLIASIPRSGSSKIRCSRVRET